MGFTLLNATLCAINAWSGMNLAKNGNPALAFAVSFVSGFCGCAALVSFLFWMTTQ